jgi:uncharacterized membrane protein YdfJ with MMPL/SSD domain
MSPRPPADKVDACPANRLTEVVPVNESHISSAAQSARDGAPVEPRQQAGVGRSGWTGGRIAALVIGALLVLSSLVLLGAGGTALWADRTQRDGGYATTDAHEFSTSASALATERTHLGSAGVGWLYSPSLLGKVRIRVTPVSAGPPLFVGIARSADVDRYLAGVNHTLVSDFFGNKVEAVGGGTPRSAPGTQNFWVASSSGPGARNLVWDSTKGAWTVVVMNADGRRGIDVRADLGARVPALLWIAVGLLVAGAVLLVGGVLLIAGAMRGGRASRAGMVSPDRETTARNQSPPISERHGDGKPGALPSESKVGTVSAPSSMNLTLRAARWSAAHRWKAVLGWLAFVVVAFGIGSVAGVVKMTTSDYAIGDSGAADTVLAREFPNQRSLEEVLIQSRTGRGLAPAQLRPAVNDLVTRLSRTPAVASIRSPLDAANAEQISRDRRSALVTFQITGDPDTAQDRVGPALAATAAIQRAHPALFIGQVGDASANNAINKRIASDFKRAEVTSLPVTLVILVAAFGALVAAGIPLLLGLTSVLAALGLTALLSHLLHVDQSIQSVILLIGLAVGVDYSLFYLRREREERARGRAPAAALEAAAATSGRAVLISGLTVMTAMAGMFLMGSRIFWSFGMGTVLVVAIALVGSLTVLPAVLSKLGDRVDRGRVPFLRRVGSRNGGSPFWSAVVGGVQRHPVIWGGLAAALLVALAIPASRLHTVNPGAQGLPRDLPVMKVYDRTMKAFPGEPQPAIVVVSGPNVTAPAVTAGIESLRRTALATGQIGKPVSVDISASRKAARVRLSLAGTSTDAASNRALAVLRDEVIPSTIGRIPDVTVHTTGQTANSRDFNDSMKSHAPYVFVFVFALAFLLLLVTFRSIVIPLKAIVLNLLSVAASYGVLVLVFQDGRLQSLLSFHSVSGITSWLPLFLFVILFGLSMDYHVLILSRVRENHDNGMTTSEAVAHGIRSTAGVVTSAAIVMVAVFSIFATLGLLDMKMMGVGLAVAVLLDATIVRAVLLPATMTLLGEWNWYLPRWLEWLPKLSSETRVGAEKEQVEAPPALIPG